MTDLAVAGDGRSTARAGYFQGSRSPLFGWWHEPTGEERRDAAVVLVAPLAHEYMYAHRAIRRLAESLAASGFAVLRYDHYGTGDSPGADDDADLVATWRADLRAAVEVARAAAGVREVSLVGVRAGATLALAAEDGPLADRFVTWFAPASGKSFVRELRALSAASASAAGARPDAALDADAVSFAGFVLSGETATALTALRPATPAPAARALIVERDSLRADAALAAHLDAAGTAHVHARVPGYEHMMVDTILATVPTEAVAAIRDWLVVEHPTFLSREAAASPHDPFATDLALGVAAHRLRETPVLVGGGRTAFGILAEPSVSPATRGRERLCVLLLNTGNDHHVGPNRLYTRFARRWAERGWASFRADIGGIGDASPGDHDAPVNAYPEDALAHVRAIVEQLRREHGFTRVIVGGLCSGAYHAVEAARTGIPVDGIVAVNPQLYYNRDMALTIGGLTAAPDAGTAEVPRPASLAARARDRLRFVKRAMTSAVARAGAPVLRTGDRLLRVFGRASAAGMLFSGMCESIVVFSLGDLGLYYLETRATVELAQLRRSPRFQLAIVPDADHTFTGRGAQHALGELLTEAIGERFSDRP